MQTEVTKLAAPFASDCISNWNSSGFDDPFFNYTLTVSTFNILQLCQLVMPGVCIFQGCLRHCYQIEIVSECGCFYPYYGQGPTYGTTGKNSCNVDQTCEKFEFFLSFSLLKFQLYSR